MLYLSIIQPPVHNALTLVPNVINIIDELSTKFDFRKGCKNKNVVCGLLEQHYLRKKRKENQYMLEHLTLALIRSHKMM